ncbi:MULTISPECIES: hypothetical protein [Cellulophaga]|uniref:Uncharacterized protein n=1 Tax=Cellulophaga geojensis KL-A TaxID=1328323 RepID=A0ABN0RLB6_9FLAO|nr:MULTISPECIES: hypothetical protein [Cellulophaga]EWH12679.1 hypothetical protein KLA_13729 [Cellulophaga geojensis KL-A]MDO6852805.1 hypothetical protein [Cellulophaga lytica]SNQ42923.1 conserved hypothetical protein [Cellulophaga lytica]
MKLSDKTEELLVNLLALGTTIFLYYIYDYWTPMEEFPSSWRAGLLEAILRYLHNNKFGVFLGKGTLLVLSSYYIYKIIRDFSKNK